ncbi:hypothetical protein KCU62_g227, partial [Aureobasidium sp. EXF-3399]
MQGNTGNNAPMAQGFVNYDGIPHVMSALESLSTLLASYKKAFLRSWTLFLVTNVLIVMPPSPILHRTVKHRESRKFTYAEIAMGKELQVRHATMLNPALGTWMTSPTHVLKYETPTLILQRLKRRPRCRKTQISNFWGTNHLDSTRIILARVPLHFFTAFSGFFSDHPPSSSSRHQSDSEPSQLPGGTLSRSVQYRRMGKV